MSRGSDDLHPGETDNLTEYSFLSKYCGWCALPEFKGNLGKIV